MIVNIYIKKWSRSNEKSLDQTIDITCELDVELGYNNFFDGSNNEKINVKMLDDLIDNYLKIRKNHSTKCAEEIERKTKSDLTNFQIMKYEYLETEKPTWSEKI